MYDSRLSESENEAITGNQTCPPGAPFCAPGRGRFDSQCMWQQDNRIRIEHSMMEFFQPEDYRIVTDVMMRHYREHFQHELEARHFFDETFDPLSNMVGLTVEQFESRAQVRDLVSYGRDVTRTHRG